jgi:FkbM family methyltransferase
MKYRSILSFFISRMETFLGNIAPIFLLNFRRYIGYGVESELGLLSQLCENTKISLDIGANAGMYTHHMLQYSKMVYAFEPNPRYIKRLIRSFSQNVVVHPIALSNLNGESELRIPIGINGAGTLEEENDFGGAYSHLEIELIMVPMKKLDEFEIKNIGFIKIDVEGFEDKVIDGGIKTISESKPAMLIEIEERHRHNAISQMQEKLSEYGYKGYFLKNGQLHSMENFTLEKHQKVENMKKIYINNFVFLTSSHLERIAKAGLVANSPFRSIIGLK